MASSLESEVPVTPLPTDVPARMPLACAVGQGIHALTTSCRDGHRLPRRRYAERVEERGEDVDAADTVGTVLVDSPTGRRFDLERGSDCHPGLVRFQGTGHIGFPADSPTLGCRRALTDGDAADKIVRKVGELWQLHRRTRRPVVPLQRSEITGEKGRPRTYLPLSPPFHDLSGKTHTADSPAGSCARSNLTPRPTRRR